MKTQQVQNQTLSTLTQPSSPAKTLPYDFLAQLIARVFQLKGRAVDAATIDFTTIEMQIKFAKNYFYLTVGEVREAFDNGCFGKYGKVFEISVVTLCEWLDAYISTDRMKYIEAQRPKLKAITQTATVTDSERRRAMLDFILSNFMRFCTTKDIELFGAKVWDFLIELHIANAPADCNKILDLAAQKIETQKLGKHGLQLQDFIAKMTKPETYNAEKIYIAKRLLTEDFFSKILAKNKRVAFITALKQDKQFCL